MLEERKQLLEATASRIAKTLRLDPADTDQYLLTNAIADLDLTHDEIQFVIQQIAALK